MKIILNSDKNIVKQVKEKLRENNGFCPCRIEKTLDTKCMCKEFRDQIERGVAGECHCGLYIAEV